MAALWIQISQSDQPPASIPSTLQPLEDCPTCSHPLNPPPKTTARQVCVQCGWSTEPRNLLEEGEALGKQDLLRLLEQAAIESLDNMKPRKKPG